MRGLIVALGLGLILGCAPGVKGKVKPEIPDVDQKFRAETAWLEEVEGPQALEWVRGLNHQTQKNLEADPRFGRFKNQFEDILMAKDRLPVAYFIGERLYNFWQDEKSVRGLWRRTSMSSYRTSQPRWETVLDIDQLAKSEKENWVFGGADCWPKEESVCLIKLSRGGKDAKVVREFDLRTKKFVANGFVLPEAKSDLTWLDPDTVLVGTDWGPGTMTKSGYPRQVRLWKRGQSPSEGPILFSVAETDVEAEAWVSHSPDETHVFFIRVIDFFNTEILWVSPDLKEQRKLPLPSDAMVSSFHKGQLVFSLRNSAELSTANGRVKVAQGVPVSFSLKRWLELGKIEKLETIFTPNLQQAIDGVSETRDALFVNYLDNVQGRMKRFQWSGQSWDETELSLPPFLSASVASASPFRADVMLRVEGFLSPTEILYSSDGVQTPTKIKQAPARFDSSAQVVAQHWVKSADGTPIPYFEIGRKDQMSQARPTILYGYGGFDAAQTPWYLSGIGKTWLERGGRFVVANIRGGGEFGPRWHMAGLKENRPKVYADFIAVAEDLIRRGVTTSSQLGIMGGSNGGLLVGAVAVQRPDLFQAVDCQVPLLDMLNYHRWLAGDSWKGEYGDPEDPKMRAALRSYSPLQNVKVGTKYPEVFFVTSTKDDRVHPAHARKMAYLFKQMGQPFYYFENIEGGHGAAANLKQRAYRSALEFTYFSRKLDLP